MPDARSRRFLPIILLFLVSLPSAAAASGAGAASSGAVSARTARSNGSGWNGWALDPIQVFYPRNGCPGDLIELEVWNRDQGVWMRHPAHPRVPLESCQVEDAGVLLNEIRWRCVDPPGSLTSMAWVVGLEVFDPEVVESCSVDPVHFAADNTRIHVSEPPADRPFRNESHEVPVRGSVRLGGVEGVDYDVVLAIDRSASVRGAGADLLAAQLDAARAFVEGLDGRLGQVRVGIISHPNTPPRAGESTGARREIAIGADRAALLAALTGLRARGASGTQTFSSALEFGMAELRGRNPASGARERSRKVLVVASDGRRSLPFGDAADAAPGFGGRQLELAKQARREGIALHFFALAGVSEAPPEFVRSVLEASKGTFTRVPHQALATPFLDAVPLPVVEQVMIANQTTGRPPQLAALDGAGRFEGRVALVSGENQLRIRARTSEGLWTEREWHVDFDDALVVEKLLAAERERMRRLQRKHLELEASREAAPR
jgi:hypothetical protein